MKSVIAYNVRPDEKHFMTRYAEGHADMTLTCREEPLSLDTVGLAEGYDGVSTLGAPVDRKLLQALKDAGITYIASRSIGYDNIDVDAAAELGMKVSNVAYSPGSVAEYAVMAILMSLRKAKLIIKRADVQDFSLMGNEGRELKNLTVGIIGTGRIGSTVARYLSGFGCEVIGYDPYPSADAPLTHVSLEELYARADVISLHTISTPENYHLLDDEAFAAMRPDVVIVNCSRGELIDTDALIAALESGKVSAAALDVVEGDTPIFHSDWRLRPVVNKRLQVLRSFPTVTVTPHVAFYTLDVVNEMVTCALDCMREFWEKGTSSHDVTPTR